MTQVLPGPWILLSAFKKQVKQASHEHVLKAQAATQWAQEPTALRATEASRRVPPVREVENALCILFSREKQPHFNSIAILFLSCCYDICFQHLKAVWKCIFNH